MKIIKASEQKIKKPTIFVYGNEGSGKTTFASQFPNPIFIRTEEGFPVDVKCDAFDVCESDEDFIECLTCVTEDQHDYKTVVIDCIDGVEKIVHQSIMKRSKSKDMASACGGFGRAYQQADNFMFQTALPLIKKIRDKRGMWVVLIGHATATTLVDPNGEYSRFEPACIHKNKKDEGMSWMNHYRNEFDVVAFSTGKEDNVAIGYGANKRVLVCEETRRNVGKNRIRLTGNSAIIDMSFDSVYNTFVNAVKSVKTIDEQGESK